MLTSASQQFRELKDLREERHKKRSRNHEKS